MTLSPDPSHCCRCIVLFRLLLTCRAHVQKDWFELKNVDTDEIVKGTDDPDSPAMISISVSYTDSASKKKGASKILPVQLPMRPEYTAPQARPPDTWTDHPGEESHFRQHNHVVHSQRARAESSDMTTEEKAGSQLLHTVAADNKKIPTLASVFFPKNSLRSPMYLSTILTAPWELPQTDCDDDPTEGKHVAGL